MPSRKTQKESIMHWLDILTQQKEKNQEIAKAALKLASLPRRKEVAVNIRKIDKIAKEHDNLVVPGKVLAAGDPTKAYSIAAIAFSKEAERKLKEKGCSIIDIKEMLQKDNLKIVH
ncbi:MAG: hypothetical protein ACP5TJ_00745 [Candidatus Micrarchaeia archaeon]